MKTRPHDLYDLSVENVGDKPCQENKEIDFTHLESNIDDDDDDMVSLNRPELASTNIEGTPLKHHTFYAQERKEEKEEEEETDDDDELISVDDDEINAIHEDDIDDD